MSSISGDGIFDKHSESQIYQVRLVLKAMVVPTISFSNDLHKYYEIIRKRQTFAKL